MSICNSYIYFDYCKECLFVVTGAERSLTYVGVTRVVGVLVQVPGNSRYARLLESNSREQPITCQYSP